jgi:hypothetical protein
MAKALKKLDKTLKVEGVEGKGGSVPSLKAL